MIDIIIATYNRPEVVCELVRDIIRRQIPIINKIIVIDSSDTVNNSLIGIKEVIYKHSNHKNQPYQRYLGYVLAQSEYLLYLDDDMQIIDDKIFNLIESVFKTDDIVGINLKFTNKNEFLNNIVKHSYRHIPHSIVEVFHWLTANPYLEDGKMWYCGCRGKRIDEQYSEYFSGGAFCVRKDVLYNNFDFGIFDLFEQRIGMGEDIILAYTLSKDGRIYNLPESHFYHNDTGTSTYTANNRDYNFRVAYSRMYLSLQFARLNGIPKIKAVMITYWHYLWRVLGMTVIAATRRGVGFSGLQGYLSGAYKSTALIKSRSRKNFWLDEIKINLENKDR